MQYELSFGQSSIRTLYTVGYFYDARDIENTVPYRAAYLANLY